MKHWTIGRTVALSFACIATLMLAGGLFCIGLIRRTLASVQPVANQHLPLGDLAHEFERRVLNARIHFIYYVTIQKEGSKALGWEQFEGARRTLPKLESVARSCGVDEVSRETELLAANFAAYEVVLRRILDTVDRGDNRGPEFAALIRQWAATGAAMVSQGGKLSRLANEKTAQALSHTNATLESSIWITWGGCLGLLILAMMFGWLMIRSLNRKLRTIAEHVSDSANAFAGAAADVADSSRQVADGAAEQASTLERTLRAAEQVSATARELDQSADAAAETASRAEAEIVAADRGLESALGAMREIASSGASIGRIIRIVDEIAFQTNILALNAAVEAARAGEAGAGFAIVAGEVRRLAQRSAAAARETEDLIELASARTAAGSDRLTSVSQAVKRIGEFVVELKAVVERVNGGSARQLTDLRHVAGTIGQMESLTQRSVASAGLTAESARTLSDEAQTLRLTAEGLTSMVGSGG